jgi:hypothetical protein
MATSCKRFEREQAAVLLIDHRTGLLSLIRNNGPDRFKKKRTKIVRTVGIVLCAALMLSTTAIAETLEERQACIGDALHFCSSAIPNRDRVLTCLMNNRGLISAACESVIAPNAPVGKALSRK